MNFPASLVFITCFALLQADETASAETTSPFSEGEIALVRVHETPLQKEDKVLMRLALGTELTIQAVKGDWVGGAVRTEQEWKSGWVKKENLVPLAEAGEHFRRELERDPKSYRLLLINARLRRDDEKLDESRKLYDRAVALQPDQKEAYRQRGYLRYLREDHRGAVADYDRVLQLDKRDALAFTNRALNHQALGNFEQAVRDYERAIELSSQNVLAMNNAAWLLATCEEEGIRDAKRALQLAEKSCELTSYENPNCLDTLAAVHAELGAFETAVEIIEQAMKLASEPLKQELAQRRKLYQSQREEDAAKANGTDE